ncbi:MAG: hypothetical protein GY765_22620 [bacterium]|nr:hypothetical protein [bacterium]
MKTIREANIQKCMELLNNFSDEDTQSALGHLAALRSVPKIFDVECAKTPKA